MFIDIMIIKFDRMMIITAKIIVNAGNLQQVMFIVGEYSFFRIAGSEKLHNNGSVFTSGFVMNCLR